MGVEEEDAAPPPPTNGWRTYISEELPRSVQESTDAAIRSARTLHQSSSTHLRSSGILFPKSALDIDIMKRLSSTKLKLVNLREHPALAAGVTVSACLLLLPGPRRFLFRQTLGRLQSEEAQFMRAEKNVKEFTLSVDLMKKESKKLLERSVLAEKDMKRGHSDLRYAGNEIQSLARSVYKAETAAADLMDLLREIPGREALKLRADVASMASHLRQQNQHWIKES